MKKTMFITSVIMVVVMAIALTTSSLAWFTASGSQYVTTDSLRVTAFSSSSEGIAISHDNGETWGTNISLAGDNTYMMPFVPFVNAQVYSVEAGATEEEIAEEQERVQSALIAALLGDDPTDTENFTYDAYMIGNKLGNNGLFSGTAYHASEQSKPASSSKYDGYFVDTLLLKNVASGAGAENINFATQINFTCDTRYIDVEDGNQPKIKQDTYNKTNRNSVITDNSGKNLYDNDAVLCVAVLARIDEFMADDSTIYNQTNHIDPRTASNSAAKWELVAFAKSKGNSSSINLGKTAAEFADGQLASNSYYAYNNINTKQYSSESMRPDREYDDATLRADWKTVKVIAWYDGATLTGNNSADMNLNFNITFTKHAISQ